MIAATIRRVGEVINSAVWRLPTRSEMKPTSNVECESPNTWETKSSMVTQLARSAGETTFCDTAVNGPACRYRATTVIRKAGMKIGIGPTLIGATSAMTMNTAPIRNPTMPTRR